MKLYTLHREQWLPAPLESVFSFFSNPENLEQITPPWLRFHILDAPGKIEAGALIRYRLRIHGFPVRWTGKIAVWEPPFRFIDVQVRGPYRAWRHEHRFESRADGTLAQDHVEYGVPGGRIVQAVLVAPDLQRVFDYRERQLRNIFGGFPKF